ncbi:hypothetical protein LRX75_11670 [Rhizobium sp. DKSPLA3]|uniref:Uncharacterized protein n=1 Tax=Rhizobium quercicola TaxID=2901226 RepID=A0A9X1NRJ2_9HYPH|nr:hypothetical protein [Rhizobium quercicola]MCD7109695.1 hypothetical protein [Rhizobium quercicola]
MIAKESISLLFDTAASQDLLSALSDLAERFPHFRDGLLGLIDSGDELFRLDIDGRAAPFAGELIVRLYPGDALARLVVALRAGDSDLFGLKHGEAPVASIQTNTTVELAQ